MPHPRLTSVLLLATALACGKGRPVAAPTPVSAVGAAYPTELRWFRTAAEYRALTLQTYRAAGDRLVAVSQGLPQGSWAVILDADETVLDNSEYQKRLGAAHARFSDSSWSRWVREAAAPAVPGAAAFTHRVHTLGGRVAIVTNRPDSLCDLTRRNLAAAAIEADVVLCQQPGPGDKNPRFRRVQDGSAAPGVPPLNVLEWIGDNIQDFPLLTQSARDNAAQLAEFGTRFFALPNPMYGSWEKNPDQ